MSHKYRLHCVLQRHTSMCIEVACRLHSYVACLDYRQVNDMCHQCVDWLVGHLTLSYPGALDRKMANFVTNKIY